MTPKEKAEQLVDKMYNTQHCGIEHFPSKHYCDCSEMNFFQAKQCALITIDEMLKVGYYSDDKIYDYLHEVKKEIEKL